MKFGKNTIPGRDPDFTFRDERYWFEEMLLWLSHDDYACSLYWQDNSLWYMVVGEYESDDEVRFRRCMGPENEAYERWLEKCLLS